MKTNLILGHLATNLGINDNIQCFKIALKTVIN